MSDQRVEDDVDLDITSCGFGQFSRRAPQEETSSGRFTPTPAGQVVVDHKSQHKRYIRLIRLRAPGHFFAHTDAFAQAAL